MVEANRRSLATAIVAGDATLAEAAKARLIERLVHADAVRVLAWESTPDKRGVHVAFHIRGAYRTSDVLCCAKKWRSQFRRLGAVFG